jgi:uncharacterized protein (UPF0276 family)
LQQNPISAGLKFIAKTTSAKVAGRGDYPLSLHGVGLSIGSADPLNYRHLEKLKSLIQRYKPGLVSEHLSWGSVEGRYLNDLLPLPYDTDTLQHVVSRVEEVQDYLGHQVLIENVSSYLCFSNSTFTEWEFLSELAEHSGCAILLDINNIYVSAFNHGFNASTYIQSIPTHHVKEIHLAGPTKNRYKDVEILIDSHDQRICDDVWALYREAACIFTDVPVLIEWDSDIPPLGLLLKEAQNADNIRQGALHENVASIAG